ncbi:di-heme oxidoreductase family protein [Xaviernesmea oryzae]|uniref:di-heme oxidoreductase family protein n=1 Tax=Xaviernesmea oryzae TaxID=464029 RepID=UPI001113846B
MLPVLLAGAILPAASGPQALAHEPAISFALPRSGRPDLSADDRARIKAVLEISSADRGAGAQAFEAMPGGAATVPRPAGLKHGMAANLGVEDGQRFHLGEALFAKLWVSAPSSTQASDGLGPFYNARSCATCHVGGGGGVAVEAGEAPPSLILRLGRAAQTPDETAALASGKALTFDDPTYGHQLQTAAVPGLKREGGLQLRFETRSVTLSGGREVVLRKPKAEIVDLGYGPLDPRTQLSLRIAQPLTGLSLIEAIHPDDILALAEAEPRQGVSGRPALLRDPANGAAVLGRFGWKAQAPSLKAQAADAFSNDIGISTPLQPDSHGDCTEAEQACRKAPDGVQARFGRFEAQEDVLDLVAFYAGHLAPSSRPLAQKPQVLAGKALFATMGCAACHHPNFVTRRDAADPADAFQLIWPYSDFLLHDMGEDLFGGHPVGLAGPQDWRTPPLWGIGRRMAYKSVGAFLHDGRARTPEDAVLWHGGEGEGARKAYIAATDKDRADLLAFLESL